MKIVALLNSYVQGVSGGDSRFVEIMKRITKSGGVTNLTIVTSKLGMLFCEKRGLEAVYKLTTREDTVRNTALLYLHRLIAGILINLKVEKGTILYSSSHFLPDVIAACFLKHRGRRVTWVQTVFHIIPTPVLREGNYVTNFLSYSSQMISLELIKRNSDLLFVLNDQVKGYLVETGFPECRIHVVGAGINLSQIDAIQGLDSPVYDACFLGRLHRAKGVFDLLEIWKMVVSKINGAKLAMVITGSEETELALKRKIQKENLANNIFMLNLSGEDALRVMKSSKVFVFPSHEEGWGIAATEAMACGLPVIAYDLPVYKEIFGKSIATVAVKDTQSFSKEIIKLLENESYRATLGKKGRIKVLAYDWLRVASRELSIMQRALMKTSENDERTAALIPTRVCTLEPKETIC